ncbi:MAG: enoyl-CoA hydratase-related protein [Pseudomonadota bacterium]
MSEHILTTKTEGVLKITLHHREKKNALTVEMYETLATLFEGADADPDIRAILLEGNAEIFTAGNDLSAFLEATLWQGEEKPPVIKWIEAVALTNTPLVAAVSGPAIGIGATILLHFDFIYTDETAYFHMPFTDLATVPEAGASWILPKRFGRPVAAEFLLACEKISPQRAYEIGYITKIVKDGDVREVALDMAQTLAKKPAEAMSMSKALMRQDTDAFLAHIEKEARQFASRLQSGEMQAVIMQRMQAKKG